MRRIVGLSLAALFMSACTEPVAPVASLDLSPSFARPVDVVPEPGCSTCPVNDTYTFENGQISGSTGTSISTDTQPGSTSVASDPATVQAPSGERFLGRFGNTQTQILLAVPAGHARYSLAFDLYTIGSWDGKGRQAQSGVFKANVLSLRYRCSGSPDAALFASTFSNQLTVQQDYPANTAIGEVGGNKAGTGSFATDALDYRSAPDESNTPPFRSFGDIGYTLRFSGLNPCGTGAVTFVWSTSGSNQQNVHDESWGIDNVRIQAGS